MRRYITRKTVYIRRFIAVFIICAVVTLTSAHFMLRQYADAVCRSSCSQYGEEIINEAVSSAMQSFDLDDIIIDSAAGYMLDSNKVNEITSYLISSMSKSLSDDLRSQVSVPAGAFTGISLLSGSGPNIRVDIYAVGSPEIELVERFETAGINQSIFELYANISISLSALMPSKSVSVTVSRQVLLTQRVIIGDVPQLYYPQTE